MNPLCFTIKCELSLLLVVGKVYFHRYKIKTFLEKYTLLFDLDFNFCEFVWFHVVGAGKVIIIGTWQSLRLVMKGKMLLICQ